MEEGMDIVKEVVERNFRAGVSAKTNKPWAIHKITTNGGKEAQTFDDVEPGDTVKLTYSEEYKSWNAAKPRVADTNHAEVMKALREIYKVVKRLEGEGVDEDPQD